METPISVFSHVAYPCVFFQGAAARLCHLRQAPGCVSKPKKFQGKPLAFMENMGRLNQEKYGAMGMYGYISSQIHGYVWVLPIQCWSDCLLRMILKQDCFFRWAGTTHQRTRGLWYQKVADWTANKLELRFVVLCSNTNADLKPQMRIFRQSMGDFMGYKQQLWGIGPSSNQTWKLKHPDFSLEKTIN